MTDATVIKLGGAVLEQDLSEFWRGVKEYRVHGPVLIVHGGGPQSTTIARKLGHEPTLVHGRRVTSDIDLTIAKMTLGGLVNIDLVASALSAGLPAVGIAGISGRTVEVVRRPPWTVDGETVDFGHVGDVVRINVSTLNALLEADTLPIVACMGISTAGDVFNVNADTIAAEIAGAFAAQSLLLVTDSGGIRDASGEIIAQMSVNSALAGIEAGWIQGGMIVKVNTATRALKLKVRRVQITDLADIADPHAGTLFIEDTNV